MDISGGGGQLDAEFYLKENKVSDEVIYVVASDLRTPAALPVFVGKDRLPDGPKLGAEGGVECKWPQHAPEAMLKFEQLPAHVSHGAPLGWVDTNGCELLQDVLEAMPKFGNMASPKLSNVIQAPLGCILWQDTPDNMPTVDGIMSPFQVNHPVPTNAPLGCTLRDAAPKAMLKFYSLPPPDPSRVTSLKGTASQTFNIRETPEAMSKKNEGRVTATKDTCKIQLCEPDAMLKYGQPKAWGHMIMSALSKRRLLGLQERTEWIPSPLWNA
jgi:hypothetical protein